MAKSPDSAGPRGGRTIVAVVAFLVAVVTRPAGPVGCAETCGRDDRRCVGNRLQICSSEHDAWLEQDTCGPDARWPAEHCVSLDDQHAFCSLAEATVPGCLGHETTCLNGALVACTAGYATNVDDTCASGSCVVDARGSARCDRPATDAGATD